MEQSDCSMRSEKSISGASLWTTREDSFGCACFARDARSGSRCIFAKKRKSHCTGGAGSLYQPVNGVQTPRWKRRPNRCGQVAGHRILTCTNTCPIQRQIWNEIRTENTGTDPIVTTTEVAVASGPVDQQRREGCWVYTEPPGRPW